MTEQATNNSSKSMDDIVALCRRRGFIFQSSEIYGGINGFWDYGPLGVLLKNNLKNAWWNDIVTCPPDGPDGKPLDIVGLDSTIIMNPKVWEASGHVAGFNDPMVDDKETKQRFRADHFWQASLWGEDDNPEWTREETINAGFADVIPPMYTMIASTDGEAADIFINEIAKKIKLNLVNTLSQPLAREREYKVFLTFQTRDKAKPFQKWVLSAVELNDFADNPEKYPSPFSGERGSLTKPRQFNLMFDSYVGAVRDEDAKAYLRPETAQGIFANFWNIVDTSRVKVPFGVAQVGKAFRNEVTPRNYTFRSREFEQMEIEFFIPDPAVVGEEVAQTAQWYQYWRDRRYQWWQTVGLAGDNLILREHDKDELAHYAKEGAGTSDVEYRFPFTAPGFGELEGIAHRTNFDLRQHALHVNHMDEQRANKMRYFDQQHNSHYFPHVIEPSAGADRGALAILCEAYTPDPSRPSKVYMNFTPRMAPIKAAIFPLVNKDGMPEKAEQLYRQLRRRWVVQFDAKQNIGKRYARMDEAGTPYCITIDGDTLNDNTVTIRERNTQQQERVNIDQVEAFLAQRVG